MWIEYNGWNEAEGACHHRIFFDETRTDYKLIFKDGAMYKQAGPFQWEEYDWNNDGDVYPLFGAVFDYFRNDGTLYGRNFFSPEMMIDFLMEGTDPAKADDPNQIISISGIKIK